MSSLIQGSHIYTGAWIDWSRGPVLGSTITLSARTGAVLTAFLAFFVTIIGACLWRIICYLIHQFSATSDARDGIHHQHQLIFRNTLSPASAALNFTEAAVSWRKNGERAWIRSLPLAGFALLFMLGFGAASLLTSLVTKSAGAARLIISDHCGYWALDDNGAHSLTAMTVKDLGDTYSAAQYSRNCYDDAQSSSLECNTFTKKNLSYTVNATSECPFSNSICNGTAFTLDTQRLNSHLDFGINTPKASRVDFRKVTTCAPLLQDGYVFVETADGVSGVGAEGDRIRNYAYGGWTGTGGLPNVTWLYNQHAFVDNFGYQFEAILHRAGETSGAWQPISELDRADADVTIMFLAPNAIQFDAPNDDPFYHANYEVPMDILGLNQTFWLSDNWVNVMACTDQYQFCNPLTAASNPDACTPLAGYYDAVNVMLNSSSTAAHKLGLNSMQSTVGTLISLSLRSSSVYHSISNRGSGALVAQESVNLLEQTSLAPNQWQVEARSWFTTSLAKLQRLITSYAAGPEHVVNGSHIVSPSKSSPEDALNLALCYSQKVNATSDTISFSVLGCAVILAVGALTILTYLILESVVGYVQKRWRWGDYRRLRWVMDDKMQVQRMAFEEAGMGSWSNLSGNVPVTERGQVFGGLGHVDPDQPRLGERWAMNAPPRSTGTTGLTSATIRIDNDIEIASVAVGGSGALTPMRPYPEHGLDKSRLAVYEKPVYQALTPLGSQGRL